MIRPQTGINIILCHQGAQKVEKETEKWIGSSKWVGSVPGQRSALDTVEANRRGSETNLGLRWVEECQRICALSLEDIIRLKVDGSCFGGINWACVNSIYSVWRSGEEHLWSLSLKDGQFIIPSGKLVNLSVPQFLNLYSKDNNTYPGGIVTMSMWNNTCKAFRVVPGT